MNHCGIVLGTALILDYLIGDPRYYFHPVRLTGNIISFWDRTLYRTGKQGLFRGVALFLSVIVCVIGPVLCFHYIFDTIHPICLLLFHIFIVYSCIAYKDLVHHCRAVYDALERGNLSDARHAVSMIVGRETKHLDKPDIGRAVIETLAENYVDGFLAPVLWYAAGCFAGRYFHFEMSLTGIILIVVYRTVNTLDSMAGYKNDRYLYFGRFSARLDDIMNYIPARLSVFLLAISSFISRMKTAACIKITLRDRMKHTSPNAGHPESCVAGALGIQLGGPIRYPYGTVDKLWMGSGTRNVRPEHIREGLKLIKYAFFISSFIIMLAISCV